MSEMDNNDLKDLTNLALRMRKRILKMSLECEGSTHLGGGLSMVEITASLYANVMNFDATNPTATWRDRFILSKGHGVLGFFPALVEVGLITEEEFGTFKQNDSHLIAHPVMNLMMGIESSNGSLGQGLSLGAGIAWAAKHRKEDFRTFVLMGDGECNEGSVWEAAMSASQYGLGNLCAIVDYNKMQSDGQSAEVIDSSQLPEKWASFGWEVLEVNGHDFNELVPALSVSPEQSTPRVVIAHTVKGKGISFMENNNEWHHNRITRANYEAAMADLGG